MENVFQNYYMIQNLWKPSFSVSFRIPMLELRKVTQVTYSLSNKTKDFLTMPFSNHPFITFYISYNIYKIEHNEEKILINHFEEI